MFRGSIHAVLIVAALWLLPKPSNAETRVISSHEQDDWNAVGRLNTGGIEARSGCTATLVAPDLILTAAHCVPDPNADFSKFRFVAGWNRGAYAAIAEIKEVFIHPENIPGPLSHGSVYADIAMLRLSEPLSIRPMPIGSLPDRTVPLAILGYRNSAIHAPTLQIGCAHRVFRPNVVSVACPVMGGNSGSPLVDITPVGPRIVSVISAQWGSGALAVRPQDWMRAHLPHLPSSNLD